MKNANQNTRARAVRGSLDLTPATAEELRPAVSAGSEIRARRASARPRRFAVLLFVLGGLLLPPGVLGAEPSDQASAPEKTGTLWFVAHTHWEGAVFKTREEYLDMGLPIILKALKLLEAHPDYRFVLDQVSYVKPFLERYPEEEAAFRKFLAEGRLQLVGGTDVMPDVNMPSGESFVRQILYGKGYYREKLGVDVTVGWQLDTFGHHAQIPQIMKLAGYRSFWCQRGASSYDVPMEFIWEGLDGTRIPTFWLAHSYAITYGSPNTFPEFADFFNQRFDVLERGSQGMDRVGLAGADVSEPEEHLPVLAEQFNRQPDARFKIRIAVPTDFEAVVAKRADRPVIKGELNPIFQGTYSSRIEMKQWTRELERLLTTVEELGALSNLLGVPTDDEAVWRAWEPVLFNQAHDLASGVMTDRVFEDSIRGFEFSKRLADELIEKRLNTVLSRIDTSGEGMPITVFNTLSWPRTDVAEVEVGFAASGVGAVEVFDPAGQAVPVQFVRTQRYGDGGLRRATITFLARDVPALGHSVYRLRPAATQAKPEASGEESADSIQNEFYRATFNPLTGEMTGLTVKADDWQVLDGPANVVSRQHDAGDFWELYRPLAAGFTTMKDQQPVPKAGEAKFSNEQTAERGSVVAGPVFSEFQVAHPFGEEGSFATSVKMYAGLRRIEVRTQLVNQTKFVRYQVLFPTSIKDGGSVHEIPFGAIERPMGMEFPAQNWVDYGNGEKGLALLNRGQPGNIVSDGTLMLSLMRSTRIVAYGFGGGYEKGMSSDGGFDLDKELTFEYALVPHAGDWSQAEIYREGFEFNHPLIVRKTAPHAGTLPKQWGLLEISHPNCVVSALKPGKGGATVLRVYEATGKPAPGVKIKFQAQVTTAQEVNLMEDPIRKLEAPDNTVSFDLAPFEIKTFLLQLEQ